MGAPQSITAQDLGLPEGTPILNMNSPTFADDFKAATGIQQGDHITIKTPQFDRVDDKEVVVSETIDFKNLPNLSHDEIIELGCGVWNRTEARVHYLFPKEWYTLIPGGLVVEVIDGTSEIFQPGETDDDYRFGLLAYGFFKLL